MQIKGFLAEHAESAEKTLVKNGDRFGRTRCLSPFFARRRFSESKPRVRRKMFQSCFLVFTPLALRLCETSKLACHAPEHRPPRSQLALPEKPHGRIPGSIRALYSPAPFTHG